METELALFVVLFVVAIVIPVTFILVEVRRHRRRREKLNIYLDLMMGRRNDHLD